MTLLGDYAAGVLLRYRRLFADGDQIISGSFEGTVIKLSLRYTTLDTHDGMRVYLPNKDVLTNALINVTANGSRRSDFAIGVAYGTDLSQARRVVIDAVGAVPDVVPGHLPEAWIEELAPSWVSIRIRFWHPPRAGDLWRTRSSVMAAVLHAVEEAGIELPLERSIVDVATPLGAVPQPADGGNEGFDSQPGAE